MLLLEKSDVDSYKRNFILFFSYSATACLFHFPLSIGARNWGIHWRGLTYLIEHNAIRCSFKLLSTDWCLLILFNLSVHSSFILRISNSVIRIKKINYIYPIKVIKWTIWKAVDKNIRKINDCVCSRDGTKNAYSYLYESAHIFFGEPCCIKRSENITEQEVVLKFNNLLVSFDK